MDKTNKDELSEVFITVNGDPVLIQTFVRAQGVFTLEGLCWVNEREVCFRIRQLAVVKIIEKRILEDFTVTEEELRNTARSKGRHIVYARDLWRFLLYEYCGWSLTRVARHVGNASHASVILACRKFGECQFQPPEDASGVHAAYEEAKAMYRSSVFVKVVNRKPERRIL